MPTNTHLITTILHHLRAWRISFGFVLFWFSVSPIFGQKTWPCDNFYYSDGMTGIGYLSINDPNANNFTYPFNFNALAFNPIDNYLYGISRLSGGERGIVRFYSDGSYVQLTTLAAMGITIDPVVGGCDDLGFYYIREGNATNTNVAKINLNNFSFILYDSGPYNAKDWAHRNIDNKFYGIDANNLHVFTPGQGSVIKTISNLSEPTLVWGSAFFASDGYLYAVNNVSYNLYKIDVEESKAYLIRQLTKDPNDGASCYKALPPYRVTFATDDKICLPSSSSIQIEVLANDSVHMGKIDTNSFSVILNAKNGITSFNKNNGILTYTPSGVAKNDSLRYKICSKGSPVTCHEAMVYITPQNQTVPIFNNYGPYCQSESVDTLPNTSLNNIKGNWNDNIIESSISGSFEFVFYPEKDLHYCIDSINIFVDILKKDTVTFILDTVYCQGEIPDLLNSSSANSINGMWSPSNINTSILGNTTYKFTVDRSQHRCAEDYTLNVKVNQLYNPQFKLDTIYCEGEPTNFLATTSDNGILGKWSIDKINTSVVGSSQYQFTADKNLYKCANEFNIDVEVFQNQKPTFDVKQLYCVGSNAEFLPNLSNENIQGTWSPIIVNTSVVGNTNFIFTPANVYECISNTNVNIEVIDRYKTPTISGDQVICFGASYDTMKVVVPNGASAQWYDQNNLLLSSISTFLPSKDGSYYVKFIGSDASCNSDSINFSVNQSPQIIKGQGKPYCFPDSTQYGYQLSVSGGAGILSVKTNGASWSLTNNNLYTLSNIGGLFSFVAEISDGNNCKDSVEILADFIPTLNIEPHAHITCIDTCITLKALANLSELQYIWSDGITKMKSNSGDYKICGAGNYSCYVKDKYGCVSKPQSTIIDDLRNVVDAKINSLDNFTLTCLIKNITLNFGQSNSSNTKLEWLDANKIISNNNEIVVNHSGEYFLRVIDTITGCTSETSVLINEDLLKPTATLNTPELITCRKDSVSLFTNNTNVNYLYQWSKVNNTDTVYIFNANQNLFVTDNEGVYCLSILNTTNNCENTICTVVKTDKLPLPISIQGKNSLDCKNQSTTLEAIVPSANQVSYQWSPTSSLLSIDPSKVIAKSSGKIFVQVTNEINGCRSFDSINILAPPVINVLWESGNEGCINLQNGIIVLANENDINKPYQVFLNQNAIGQKEKIKDLSSGIYSIVLEDKDGCKDTTDVNVKATEVLNIDLPATFEGKIGEQILLAPTSNIDTNDLVFIEWSPTNNVHCFDCFSTYFIGNEDQTLILKVEDQNGCTDEAMTTIRLKKDINIILPNIISENSGNDVFTIFVPDGYSLRLFNIYDRWGNMVFHHDDANTFQGWDGTMNGKKLDLGVYTYFIQLLDPIGENLKLSGDVTLIR